MAFNITNFRILIYGYKIDSINAMKDKFKTVHTESLVLNDILEEKNVINYYLKTNPSTTNVFFINADTMKKVNIIGSESIYNLIILVEKYIDLDIPYIILFNRYQDSGIQCHFIKNEIIPDVSLFQSFNPTNSDAFYLSSKLVSKCRNNIHISNLKKKIFSDVRIGDIDCYSFNPNLFTFKIEDSCINPELQALKTSILKSGEIRSTNENIYLFFSDHIILFWIFLVFFICIILIILIKVFKLQNKLFK